MDDELLPMEEAARVLGISKPTLYRLVSQGTVRGLKAGKQWRFRREDLNAYLEQTPLPVPDAPAGLAGPEIAFFADELRRVGQEPAQSEDGTGETDTLFDLLTRHAIASGASDMHLEPVKPNLRLRFRIDGLLHIVREMPAGLRDPLIGTIKERAQMNPAERQLPQDGRITYPFAGKEFELRVSSVRTLEGEAIVARILDRSEVLIGLDKLGLSAPDRERLNDWREQPNGLIVVTGPTGSGRSTLLYSLLRDVNAPDRKILTLEDPVELRLAGVSQIPVGKRSVLTVAQGLRAALRQDPDILYVSEIPDAETAQLLHEAALTGHLAFTSLFAGRAAEVPGWLVNRGVEPLLVSSTLLGVAAVRLLRRICESCREPLAVSPDNPTLARLRELSAEGGYTVPTDAVFYHGRGCPACRGRGYRGRTGLFEVLPFSPILGDAVLRDAPPEELEAIAIADGMKTLLADGMEKAIQGITTYEEVLRVAAGA